MVTINNCNSSNFSSSRCQFLNLISQASNRPSLWIRIQCSSKRELHQIRIRHQQARSKCIQHKQLGDLIRMSLQAYAKAYKSQLKAMLRTVLKDHKKILKAERLHHPKLELLFSHRTRVRRVHNSQLRVGHSKVLSLKARVRAVSNSHRSSNSNQRYLWSVASTNEFSW